jgi:hypothetical protein
MTRPEDLKKRLAKAEKENAKLKEAAAKNEADLRVLGEHSTMMECEASDASKARDRAEAKLLKLSEEVEGLCAENAIERIRRRTPSFRRIIPSSRRIWGNSRISILKFSSS